MAGRKNVLGSFVLWLQFPHCSERLSSEGYRWNVRRRWNVRFEGKICKSEIDNGEQ